jgi:hypothetical protein
MLLSLAVTAATAWAIAGARSNVCDLNGSQVREMSNLRKHLKLLLLDCGQV